jgi:hypothetical protein
MPSRLHSERPFFDRPWRWRDGARFLIISRHLVPGYYRFVPSASGTGRRFLNANPALRPGLLSLSLSGRSGAQGLVGPGYLGFR